MKSLAGNAECDAFIVYELWQANIRIERLPEAVAQSEVPYRHIGRHCGWGLRRAWTYWVATAPPRKGLPLEPALALNDRWRDIVRVDGCAGGHDVPLAGISALKTVDLYHIDTQDGLDAWAKAVREATLAKQFAEDADRLAGIIDDEARGILCDPDWR